MTRANSQGLYLSEVNEPFPPWAGVLPLLLLCLSGIFVITLGNVARIFGAVCMLASLKFAKY